jgi:hypothetical protein
MITPTRTRIVALSDEPGDSVKLSYPQDNNGTCWIYYPGVKDPFGFVKFAHGRAYVRGNVELIAAVAAEAFMREVGRARREGYERRRSTL